MFELRGHIDETGKKRFARSFEGLHAIPAAKATIALTRIERGNLSNTKGVGKGVLECKIDFGPGCRICFGKDGERLVILIGGGPGNGRTTTLQRLRCAGPITNGGKNMPLTHDFKETIRARAQREPKFRQALLREAVESYLTGDLQTGKSVLRDYVNATIGFQALEEQTDIPVKSLMRMLGPKGSPSAANLSSILTVLQKTEGVHFELSLRR